MKKNISTIFVCLLILSIFLFKTDKVYGETTCNRCSTENGCQRVQFTNQTSQCDVPDNGVTINRIKDCSCPSISNSNNSLCTTCATTCNRCSTWYDYCRSEFQSVDNCQTGENVTYSVDCSCPTVGNSNCPAGNTYKCIPRPAPSPPPKFLKGIEVVYENSCWARHDEVPRTWTGQTVTDDDIKYAKEQGLDFLNVHLNGPVGWYNIAKENPNQAGHSPEEWNNPYYNFGPLDTAVEKIANAGILPVLNIWGTPQWANGIPNGANNDGHPECFDWGDYAQFPPTDLNQFGYFMKAVTERYSGRHGFPKVDNYVVWAEPNIFYWGVGNNDKIEDFVTMSNFAYGKMKETNPEVQIWGANLSPTGADPGQLYWLRKAADLGYKMDKIGIRGYPFNWDKSPTEQPAYENNFTMVDVANLFNTIDQIPAYKNLPVIITESGYALNYFSSGSTAEREVRQAEYLLQNLNYAKAYFPRIEGWTNFFLYYAPTYDTAFLGCKVVQPDTSTCYHCCDKSNGYDSYYKRPAFYTFRDFGSTSSPTPTPTSTQSFLPGDLDKNGKVNISDYNTLLQNFGNTACNNVADIDGTCTVDIFDYNILVGNFGPPAAR